MLTCTAILAQPVNNLLRHSSHHTTTRGSLPTVELGHRTRSGIPTQKTVALGQTTFPELAASIGWTWGRAPEGSLTVARLGENDFALTLYAGSTATEVSNSRGVRFQKAKLMEFGTKEMPAHPYFFPVVRAYRRTVTRRINAAARKAAKAVWSR